MNNENLAEMLSNFVEPTKEEEKKEMVNENTENSEVVATPSDETEKDSTNTNIQIIPFTKWIEKNNVNLGPSSDVTKVKISVSDVDAAASIGFKAPNLKGEKDEEGKIKKDLFFVKEISNINVLDLPVYHIKFYKGDLFRIIHQYSPEIFIKEYCSKSGSILVFCTPVENYLIPYSRMKTKRKATEIAVEIPDLNKINEKMSGNGDIEGLQLMYKQSINAKDKLTSMKEIASWLLKRYESAIDVNHQLQIDGVLISQFK
jgi:hypothetical protein